MHQTDKTHPHIWQWDYLGMKPLLRELKHFAATLPKQYTLLDLGCGTKPYRSVFTGATTYTGLDIVPGAQVDIVGEAWNLPFPDASFDVLISTQVLEHTRDLDSTIKEIQRVVKPGGYIFISAPFAFVEHGQPYDYWRFTQFGLRHLLRNFTIVSITGLSGYINTLCRLLNTLLQYFPYSWIILAPTFMFFNVFALAVDALVATLARLFKNSLLISQGYHNAYLGMPEDYCVVLRNTMPAPDAQTPVTNA
ncbi:MAG: class I SAM-dependent methyltransferase [Candidatus Kerfeldbacteria bacterium]|nr:class I SAM-dependent methyltransferase [Candidatus Kerfeldbacteria bacterium]